MCMHSLGKVVYDVKVTLVKFLKKIHCTNRVMDIFLGTSHDRQTKIDNRVKAFWLRYYFGLLK